LADQGLLALSAADAVAAMARGEFSAEDYTRACVERITAIDGEVRAFAHFDPQYAIEQARERDEWRQSGRALGALHGVPVAIKDIFDTEDFPTECGSSLLSGRRPRRDAAAVERLRAAGAVIIGKSVTTEFAYFHPGPTRNPHDVERTPGGSSSGSAAAVAASMAPLAIGTQTNGSVIRPAAFCGVFGIKPSHGTISRARTLMLSQALDHVGVFARTLADAALLLDVLAGFDPDDPDSRPHPAPAFLSTLREPPPLPPHFGFVRTSVWDKADSATRAAFEQLVEQLGDAAHEIELSELYTPAWDDHRAIMASDMAHHLGSLVERGGDKSSPAIRDIVAEGRGVTAVRYLAAKRDARRYAEGLGELFNVCNAVLTPAAPGVAPKGEATGNPAFCTLWTLTGLPAVTLPLLVGEDDMPLGVQLIGAAGDDARLLRTANWLVERLRT
jgi:Asp-tRNA(Asn)/Glu-tRNA(Gln) amidotransferase A subunit family amidase